MYAHYFQESLWPSYASHTVLFFSIHILSFSFFRSISIFLKWQHNNNSSSTYHLFHFLCVFVFIFHFKMLYKYLNSFLSTKGYAVYLYKMDEYMRSSPERQTYIYKYAMDNVYVIDDFLRSERHQYMRVWWFFFLSCRFYYCYCYLSLFTSYFLQRFYILNELFHWN